MPGFGKVKAVRLRCNALSRIIDELWLWSMGSFLNSLVQPGLRRRIGVVSFTVTFPSLYVLGCVALFQSVSPIAFAVLIPLLLVAAFCMFYNFYFVSKSLAIAETGKSAPVVLSHRHWFIQPRINRLYAKMQTAELSEGPTGH